MNSSDVLDTYRTLDRMHAWRGWHWWPDADPFEVIAGSILVQNTSWSNVERALERLRAAGTLDPARMDALPHPELEALIQPSGQYRQKARKLRAFLNLVAAHGSLAALLELPPELLRAELLATWGIGPETADCIVCYAARQPALVVDGYTMRFFGRLGVGPQSLDYHTWQRWLLERLPPDRDILARFHALVVLHCKHTCRKREPACDRCDFAASCAFARSRG